jgi:nitrogen-specific signal transduction histidine kinase/HAMP domain-containing protein
LPRLTLSNAPIPGGEIWETEQNSVSLGNVRKQILVSVRTLPQIGFLVVQAIQDYQNLPFVASSSPFQELFRPVVQAGDYDRSLFLNVYDSSWHPIFVSDPDFSPPVPRSLNLLRSASSEWVSEQINDNRYLSYYFRMNRGFGSLLLPAVSFRSHIVHLIDLLLLNLLWLSVFGLVMVVFFKAYLGLHFTAHAPTGFNFFQKMMLAFVVFSMVPMMFLSLFIRNYVWQKKVDEVTSGALTSFSVAAKVVGDYFLYRAEEQNQESTGPLFNDELLEWISQVIQQDVSLYNERSLLATSYREFFSAGLLGQRIPARTYGDLFLESKLYSISEAQIGSLKFLNVSGRVHYMDHTNRQPEGEASGMEAITIPFLIDEQGVQAEIVGLREYMMLVGAGLILFAVFLGYFLASRFSQPVRVLIHGTGEMSQGNLEYRIREEYQDEFRQLVDSFNAMAGSLTDQRQALERRREYIENILKNITTAVISIDRTTFVTTINPAAVEMFQLDPFYHRQLEKLIPSNGPWAAMHELIMSVLSDRERYQVKEISISRDKEELTLRLVYVPLFEEREWNGAVLLIEDISDIIRSNRLSAWAEMARRVAHEVKNPLTPIQLAMEHLVKVYEDRSENFSDVLKSCADSILRQVKTLRRLVSDFSQYGRPTVLNRTEVDLPVFLEELLDHYQQHLPGGIHMEMNLEPELPPLKLDAEKIRSALMNIIENGLQAMNGQGKITLDASRGNNGLVAVRISDTGKGIPPEVLSHLFEPYFSTKAGGTGLGLAIARKNIEEHGGKIEVESKENQGTTVTILLPVPN